MNKENIVNKDKNYYLNMKNKYMTAGKEAAATGDRILSEYNFQCAEHYGRIISERFKSNDKQQKETSGAQ